jgi:hypothetical protein
MEHEEKKQRPSWQEIEERKINLVKEKGSRVMRVNSPIGSTMFSILRQFDMAYANFKGRLGEMGGITYEEGVSLMKEGQEIVMAFSDFTARLSRRVNFRYYAPNEIKDYLKLLAHQEKSEENSEGEKNSASADV